MTEDLDDTFINFINTTTECIKSMLKDIDNLNRRCDGLVKLDEVNLGFILELRKRVEKLEKEKRRH